MPIEIEIKLSLAGFTGMRARLRSLGFRVRHRRAIERNAVYDTGGEALRRAGELLRIREFGGRHKLTYKGPGLPGRHKSREEIELAVGGGAELAAIFERLGFMPVFRYEKFRTEYARSGEEGFVTFDETPIGDFLEIEGPPRWIDRIARELGFSRGDYITASYGALYQAHRRSHRGAPRDMVFDAAKSALK